jgi:antitoxin component YwqK of YwqJK toxin-antitoxin module
MKTLLTFFLVTISIWSSAQERIPEDKVVLEDSIYVWKSNGIPVTGIVYAERDAVAHVYKLEFNLINGVKEGEYKWLYNNGKLSQLEFYRNGKRVGPRRRWWMNGNLQSEWTATSTKFWYKNGQISSQTKLMIEFSAVVFLKYKGAKIAFSGLNKAFFNA